MTIRFVADAKVLGSLVDRLGAAAA
jgi:hypothetical protein